MTVVDASIDAGARARPPLGVFALVREAFALFFGSFRPLAGTSILLTLLIQGAQFAIGFFVARAGYDVMLRRMQVEGTAPDAVSIVATAAIYLLGLVSLVLVQNAMTFIAHRRSIGEPVRAGDVAGAAFRFFLPGLGAVVAVFLLVILGLVALVVPGLWVAGVYTVVFPVIVIESRRRGFLKRTARLTKDYRWPLVGFLLIVYAVMIAVGLLPALVQYLFVPPAALVANAWAGLAWVGVNSIVGGLTAALLVAATVVAYRRLVAIKEGGGAAELRAVFA